VYGWAFSVVQPQTGRIVHRNIHQYGLVGFGNAYLLTGDERYLDVWRTMIDRINREGKMIDGRMHYPHMYGDRGWYDFTPAKYTHGALQIWYWSMRSSDRDRVPVNDWLRFLDGQQPNYPETALRHDLENVRSKVAGMRADPTTPDTRLADDPLRFNPATVGTLAQLMLGGMDPGNTSAPLHCRVRYFDPVLRRAGLPEDIAALVERLTADATELTLVNVNQVEAREVVVQAGAYAEHRWTSIRTGDRTMPINSPSFKVRLDPGAGVHLVLGTKRYAQPPTLAFPWDRTD
jgi:hypothetical protein